jgi:benzoate/toluate 1,2-dioxygenase reductase component
MTTRDLRVTFVFADGIAREEVLPPDVSVLEGAIAQNVPILYQCKSGSCGTCVAQLVEGEAPARGDRATSLLPGEQARGRRLLCSTSIRSACTFALDYPSDTGTVQARKVHAFIDKVESLAADVVRLELELAEGCWLDFKPGQFIQVTVPGTGKVRRYSMASPPGDLPRLALLIRLLPNGLMSTYVSERAAVDDVLEIEGPFGSFLLREKVRAPHIMIAGGTGLAPIMSMLDVLRTAPGSKPRVILSFGCATREGLFFCDEIERRQFWLPSLQARISIDRGEPSATVRVGNPVQAITADDVGNSDTVAYLCGPPAMIAAAHEHLCRLGVVPQNIFTEQFVASEER